MKKSYKTLPNLFTLTYGKYRVAVDRPLNAKINKAIKNDLDRKLESVLELRDSEIGHRCNKEG